MKQYSILELRNLIPDALFRPNAIKSMLYFLFDFSVLIGLYYGFFLTDIIYLYPLFWFAIGTIMWSIFVVGHDCGHGSFSKYSWLNSIVGHICHTILLVPYHGWRISHRIHHSNTGNVEKDETWYPLSISQYEGMGFWAWLARYRLFLIVFPVYLFVRSTGRDGSHFLPSSPMFRSNERNQVILSSTLIFLWASFLIYLTYTFGFWNFIKFYYLPYCVLVVWLSLVTFLHHTHPSLPWYREGEWTFVKGALSSMDRKYGIFEPIHHNIGTHVVHHLFAGIPHYNLKKAKFFLKQELGDNYREAKNGIWSDFFLAAKNCIVVPNEGKMVYYQKYDLKSK
jgi:omega-3 fatty acid desaturase (delta-15 desaturase)